MELPPELARYSHELNPEGTACADDCPICKWVNEQENRSEPKTQPKP